MAGVGIELAYTILQAAITPHSFIRLRYLPPKFATFRAFDRLQCVGVDYTRRAALPYRGWQSLTTVQTNNEA